MVSKDQYDELQKKHIALHLRVEELQHQRNQLVVERDQALQKMEEYAQAADHLARECEGLRRKLRKYET